MSPLLFALLFFLNNALASPLTVVSPFSVISSHTSNATSSSIKGRPSLPPKCILRLGPSREQYGKIDYDSCDRAIAKIPREPRNHPVLRNFYVKTEDRSMTMPNMEIPVVEIEGNCIVEVLLSSSFEDVPHDQAIWQDLWGPARLILNYCVSARRTGGIIDGIGAQGRLEVVLYDARSIFGYTRILDSSPDPEARSIAMQELLELLAKGK